jgi:hypothetical protein
MHEVDRIVLQRKTIVMQGLYERRKQRSRCHPPIAEPFKGIVRVSANLWFDVDSVLKQLERVPNVHHEFLKACPKLGSARAEERSQLKRSFLLFAKYKSLPKEISVRTASSFAMTVIGSH